MHHLVTRDYAPSASSERRIRDHYKIVGFISSGTYGRVYKAVDNLPSSEKPQDGTEVQRRVYAIKKSVLNHCQERSD